MKFGKVGPVGKVTLVIATALGVATLFTACSTLTVGFLFVATTKQTPGQIEVYEVNSLAGSLRTIPTSPFPSGGRNPVAEAVSPDFKNLYVANQDDNNIVQFAIGSDGKLYPQSTVNTPGSFPLAIAMNTAGTFLYVVDTLEPIAGCSLANPCPGALAVFPVDKTTGALGTPVVNNNSSTGTSYWPLVLSSSTAAGDLLTPTGLDVLSNGNDVYVSAFDPTASKGYVFAFTANSDGTLSEQNGGAAICLKPSGSSGCLQSDPVALTSDSTNSLLYVVDKLNNQIDTFSVSSLGVTSRAPTGNQPSAVALFGDNLVYVTNSLDSTVSAYTASSGSLTGTGTYATDVNPVAVTADPRHLGFLYTVNFLGNSLSGYKIDTTTGALINAQRSPYASSVQPVAISGIPHSGQTK